LGNAERLVARYESDIRYLVGAGWHLWNGHRFEADRTRRIIVLAGDMVRGIYAEAASVEDESRRKALGGWAQKSEARGRLEAAIGLAQSRPEVVDLFEHFDTNPWLVGAGNGVFDLERDEFRSGRSQDRITLAMNVEFDPSAQCPRWEQFQSEIHAGDAELIAFKHRALGYCLSGDTSEQKLFIAYGTGANGKTTEQRVMLELLGDYGRKIEPETLLARERSGANNDIARLKGARYIATTETEDGKHLAEALMKQLVGGDRISARYLYREHFEFTPSGKFWIATNHRPEVTGTDHAVWRRILLVPYLVRFENGDPGLLEKLLDERTGILTWLLEGFRQWRQNGLAPPPAVLAATDEYRERQDRIGNFLRECCLHPAPTDTKASAVYARYRGWSESNGMRPISARKFHDRMEAEHGLLRRKNEVFVYPNLGLLAEDQM
jgi:putative DNA primase/helicase